MSIRMLFFICLWGALGQAQDMPKWHVNEDPVWDPSTVMGAKGREVVQRFITSGPVPTKVIVLWDLSLDSIGALWFNELNKHKPSDPDYAPAGILIDLITKDYQIGEDSPGPKSLALLVTAKRGNPALRWTISTSQPKPGKISSAVLGKAYLAFANAINSQGDRDPAHSDKLTEGVLASLGILYDEIGKTGTQ